MRENENPTVKKQCLLLSAKEKLLVKLPRL